MRTLAHYEGYELVEDEDAETFTARVTDAETQSLGPLLPDHIARLVVAHPDLMAYMDCQQTRSGDDIERIGAAIRLHRLLSQYH